MMVPNDKTEGCGAIFPLYDIFAVFCTWFERRRQKFSWEKAPVPRLEESYVWCEKLSLQTAPNHQEYKRALWCHCETNSENSVEM